MHAGGSGLAVSGVRSGLAAVAGVPLAEVYLEFLAGRCRPNTVRAAASDLCSSRWSPNRQSRSRPRMCWRSSPRSAPAVPAIMVCCSRWIWGMSRAGGRLPRCAGACRSCRVSVIVGPVGEPAWPGGDGCAAVRRSGSRLLGGGWPGGLGSAAGSHGWWMRPIRGRRSRSRRLPDCRRPECCRPPRPAAVP